MIAVENEKSATRKEALERLHPKHGHHLPYEMLASITAIRPDGSRQDIIRDGPLWCRAENSTSRSMRLGDQLKIIYPIEKPARRGFEYIRAAEVCSAEATGCLFGETSGLCGKRTLPPLGTGSRVSHGGRLRDDTALGSGVLCFWVGWLSQTALWQAPLLIQAVAEPPCSTFQAIFKRLDRVSHPKGARLPVMTQLWGLV